MLFYIVLTHLLLAFFHAAYSFYTDHSQCFIRCGFCAGIALFSFLFLRKGFSYSILVYSCVLLYFNNFYNYTSFLFVLFAIYATPKIEKHALIIYALNVFIALSIKNCELMSLGIHSVNCVLFYFCSKYVFAVVPDSKLLLTDDERLVLAQLAEGKLQKEIDAFSPNTITKLIRNAQERNGCKTKTELIHKYLHEQPQKTAIESQTDMNESQL